MTFERHHGATARIINARADVPYLLKQRLSNHDETRDRAYDHNEQERTAYGLETMLAGLGVGRLVVVGAETDACIRSTIHGALVRGYDATLVSDAHTTADKSAWGAPTPDVVIAHTNLYWKHQTAPGRTAGTVETKGVDFGGTS